MESNQEATGNKIVIKGYEDHDGYQTLIGQVEATRGISQSFEIHISGQPKTIRSYTDNAVFLKLELVQNEDALKLREEHRAKALDNLRAKWLDRLNEIHDFVVQATEDQLADPLLLCNFPESKEKPALPYVEFDPKIDRRIEILPLHDPQPNYTYALSAVIDPDILQGAKDWYAYKYGNPDENDASMGVSAGDADLYLYRGSVRMGSSIKSGRGDEYVYGRHGQGSWEVMVYGFRNATYTLDSSWY